LWFDAKTRTILQTIFCNIEHFCYSVKIPVLQWAILIEKGFKWQNLVATSSCYMNHEKFNFWTVFSIYLHYMTICLHHDYFTIAVFKVFYSFLSLLSFRKSYIWKETPACKEHNGPILYDQLTYWNNINTNYLLLFVIYLCSSYNLAT